MLQVAADCRHDRHEMAACCVVTFFFLLSRSMLACPPTLIGQFHNHPQFCPLLFLGKKIFLLRGSEAALRRQTQLLQRHIFCGSVDTALRTSLDSSRPDFDVTSPSTTVLSLGTKRSGSNPPARSLSYSMK